MSNQSMENSNLCSELLSAESEKDVIRVLKKSGYWDDSNCWQIFGNKENNFSIIGNQTAFSANALVEKLVNSIDAVLLKECKLREINPESDKAPQSISEALELFFNIKKGNLANIGATQRTKLADNIGLVATGLKGLPNFIVFDKGEGQTPVDMPSTFLSLSESNKLRIPFVQGKFNMGGTGVYQFCGERNINLIISKKHPDLLKNRDLSGKNWGFTIVRREYPSEGRKNSLYKYLAPYKNILQFDAETIVIPVKNKGTQAIPKLSFGSIIKLYEYELPPGLKTSIELDLYNQISLLLPRVGLPVRFYERRGYGGKSAETTMSGLHVRLEEDKRENLEDNFPTSSKFKAMNQNFSMTIFAFKKDKSVKYRKDEGIILTYNGQTQGDISKDFFTRKNVGMSYIADSLLVIVDCDEIDLRTREDLFMNSRDRLRGAELNNQIKQKLEEIIKDHQGLKDLREKRKREMTESLLNNSKPLRDVINDILKNSPSLQALFTKGYDISNPFKSKKVGEKPDFIGKSYPSYFQLMPGHEYKHCHINLRFRVQFETDVVNDYFVRDQYPGNFILKLNGQDVSDYALHLWNGVANLTIKLPEGTRENQKIHGEVWVQDDTMIQPFYCEFDRLVEGVYDGNGGDSTTRKPPTNENNGNRSAPDSLSLPSVFEIHEDRWQEALINFDKFSALRVIDTGQNSYNFYVNVDNVFLKTEMKALKANEDPQLLNARFKYGLALIGIALLKDRDQLEKIKENDSHFLSIEQIIFNTTKSIAPIVLPMIEYLGELELEG